MRRRRLLHLGAASAWSIGGLSTAFAQSGSNPRRVGRLLAIGGAEDRQQDPVILRRFIELCGGDRAKILLMTAASGVPDQSWAGYEPVFKGLGAENCHQLDLRSADDANRPEVVDQILSADGIYMSGGDQRRLMSTLWETEAFRAMHIAFHLRGCCIAGTSAGAAALSRQMLAVGDTPPLPQKEAVSLDIGLGFVSHAIIDQHFSQRRRLGRLLSAMAQRADLLGVGIDEDTALLIERGLAIEVIGKGSVTLVDGRQMNTNFQEAEAEQRLEMLDVKLHLLPSGNRYPVSSRRRTLPAALQEAVALLVQPGPIRG